MISIIVDGKVWATSVIYQVIKFQTIIKVKSGHGELLELRLLEKSARHDFIIARQRSNTNINF